MLQKFAASGTRSEQAGHFIEQTNRTRTDNQVAVYTFAASPCNVRRQGNGELDAGTVISWLPVDTGIANRHWTGGAVTQAAGKRADMNLRHVAPPADACSLGACDAASRVRVTLLLKPAGSAADPALAALHQSLPGLAPAARPALSRQELEAVNCPDEAHFAAVRRFAADHDLDVISESGFRHDVILEGSAAAMNTAFAVELHDYEHDGAAFRSHAAAPTVPAELADIVVGVIGLDSYPLTGPHSAAGPRSTEVFTPLELREHYDFPESTGQGQRIAILAFGKCGFHQSDIDTYFSETLGMTAPSVNVCSVDGAECDPAPMKILHDAIGRLNRGETDFSYLEPEMMLLCRATMEATMDIQVAGAVASDAHIDVFFAPNDVHGWYHALYAALEGSCGAGGPADVISASWGASESTWSDKIHCLEPALEKAQQLHVPICCSSGDFGSLNARPTAKDMDARVNYPASSSHVIACGGTSIVRSGDSRVDVAWKTATTFGEEGTGGGVSGFLDMPDFQASADIPKHADIHGNVWRRDGLDADFRGRGVPDVAAFADIGYRTYIGGHEMFYGGTSASTPLWAGLIACVKESLGRAPGWLNHVIYDPELAAGFVPVTRGDNRIGDTDAAYFEAREGWNACCGLGVPRGQALAACLAAKYGES